LRDHFGVFSNAFGPHQMHLPFVSSSSLPILQLKIIGSQFLHRAEGFENSLTAKGSENAIYLVFRASIDLDLGW
jgi:hypothetical protein